MKNIYIIFFLILLIPSLLSSQISYTIDNTGFGDYISFTEAIDSLNKISSIPSGGIIYNVLVNQIFIENPPIIDSINGTVNDSIIFRKYGDGDNPIVQDQTLGGEIFDIRGSSYIRFDGIDVTDITPNDEQEYSVAYHITTTGNSPSGLASQNIVIKNCNISNFGYAGIHIRRSSDTISIEANEVFHTSDFLPTYYGQSFTGIRQVGSACDNIVIKNNKVYGLKSSTQYGNETMIYGIYADGSNCKIYNNFVSSNTDNNWVNAIRVDGHTNRIHNIYYNTVLIVGSSGNDLSSAMHCYGGDETTTFNIIDNIFINNREENGYTYSICIYDNNPVFNLDYNVYFVEDATYEFYGKWGDYGNINNFSDWKTITTKDYNSKSINVEFADTANYNLHLAGSSINNPHLYGIPISWITKDIDYQIRNSTNPYKGADEYYPSLTAPQNVICLYDTDCLIIRWDSVSGAVLYNVYECLNPSGVFPLDWQKVYTVADTLYIDSTLTNDMKFFKITASN